MTLPNHPTVSVVICAYTEDRWVLLKKSVASAEAQTLPPIEIIVCIDHNEQLLRQSREYFGEGRPPMAIPHSWPRCYFVNQGKVEAFANMQETAHLGAELAFVARTLTTGVLTEIRHVIRGDPCGLAHRRDGCGDRVCRPRAFVRKVALPAVASSTCHRVNELARAGGQSGDQGDEHRIGQVPAASSVSL
jgi:cellulose synthase/poly-beta-1,6-N-acetylglucosamine synthase-like glycosyltransferase